MEMINWQAEKSLITTAATARNVDPFFIMAIRQAENGSPGREFGVLSQSAPTYDDQLRLCVSTVAHRLESFPGNPLVRDAFGRIRYNAKWIAYFASIWAPVGLDVKNDPTGLNSNWVKNASAFYEEHIDGKI
jgi:hypothetical protein